MVISDPKEIEAVIAFFRNHIGRESDVTMSVFEGFTQLERMRVTEMEERGTSHYHVYLINPHSQRQLEIDLHHYSFATVSPDPKRC